MLKGESASAFSMPKCKDIRNKDSSWRLIGWLRVNIWIHFHRKKTGHRWRSVTGFYRDFLQNLNSIDIF